MQNIYYLGRSIEGPKKSQKLIVSLKSFLDHKHNELNELNKKRKTRTTKTTLATDIKILGEVHSTRP